MTTATAEKVDGIVYIGKALPVAQYFVVDDKGVSNKRVWLDKVLPDGKGIVRMYVEGYAFKTKPLTMPATTLLKAVSSAKPAPAAKTEKKGETVKNNKPKAEKAARVKKEPKAALERLPKAKPGELETVEIGGVTYRANYRARSSTRRIAECKSAKKDSCHCRCQGTFHGKDHAPWVKAESEAFEAAVKKGRSYLTAKEISALVDKFGGPVHHEPKPRGRKPGVATKKK